LHGFVVERGDDVIGHDAGLGMPALSSIGETTLIKPSSIVTRCRARRILAGLHLHVAEALGIHVSSNADPARPAWPLIADSTSFAVVGFFDVVATDSLEHIAEQIELA